MSLRQTVAAPFRHMRKDALRKSEFIFFLAIDRKWMNKEQADRLVSLAEDQGLLSQADGVLTPQFAVEEVAIPLGFKPSSAIFERDDPVAALLERIAAQTGRGESAVAAELNDLVQKRFDGHLTGEAAVVVLARMYAVPFDDMLNDLRAGLGRKK
ncbi:MAG: DUF2240 family protein [Methanomicrobiaceae archaeon]|nr:DUF2240 family protein [Methanomicrobiaceae archaeon]